MKFYLVQNGTTELATESPEALAIFGSEGTIAGILGFWCLVAGIGMFQEQEWAWGQALVVLSIIAAQGGYNIAQWIILGTFDIKYWPTWITLVAVIVGIFGFLWLLFVRRRFD